MSIIFSLFAAMLAGITTLLGKIGVKNIDITLATSIRTTIVLLFCLIVIFFVGSFDDIYKIDIKTYFFLFLSGLSTALLWLSYFKALQLSSVNKVTPIDKTSIILTLILSVVFLKERITLIKIISMISILIGTTLMVSKSESKEKNNKWILYAIYTSIFGAIATIVGKLGIKDIEPNLGMFLRTVVIFVIIWVMVILKKKYKDIKKITKKGIIFIILSGLTTGLSWLCYFKALKLGEASVVFSIEKLSIVVAIMLSIIFLKEKLNIKGVIGLIIILIGEFFLII